MDGELVNGSLSNYAIFFEQAFPAYLAMGMSPEAYWDGDPMWARDYRKAEELRNERRNQELWLQGMYIYDAILCASPILQAFAKKGTKPRPYPDQPYALTARAIRENEERREKALAEKGKRYMEAQMKKLSKHFGQQNKEKGGTLNGGN